MSQQLIDFDTSQPHATRRNFNRPTQPTHYHTEAVVPVSRYPQLKNSDVSGEAEHGYRNPRTMVPRKPYRNDYYDNTIQLDNFRSLTYYIVEILMKRVRNFVPYSMYESKATKFEQHANLYASTNSLQSPAMNLLNDYLVELLQKFENALNSQHAKPDKTVEMVKLWPIAFRELGGLNWVMSCTEKLNFDNIPDIYAEHQHKINTTYAEHQRKINGATHIVPLSTFDAFNKALISRHQSTVIGEPISSDEKEDDIHMRITITADQTSLLTTIIEQQSQFERQRLIQQQVEEQMNTFVQQHKLESDERIKILSQQYDMELAEQTKMRNQQKESNELLSARELNKIQEDMVMLQAQIQRQFAQMSLYPPQQLSNLSILSPVRPPIVQDNNNNNNNTHISNSSTPIDEVDDNDAPAPQQQSFTNAVNNRNVQRNIIGVGMVPIQIADNKSKQ